MNARRGLLAAAALAMLVARVDAHPAWGLQISNDGAMYYTDVRSNTVWARTPDGRETVLARGLHSHPLWLDRITGELYGEHLWYEPRGKSFPSYFWKLVPGGVPERIAKIPAAVREVRDGAGNRYEIRGRLVIRIAPDGAVAKMGGDPFAHIARRELSLNSIAVDDDGNLLVADPDNRCVWRVSGTAGLSRVHESAPTWTPMGVTIARGSGYVIEGRTVAPASTPGDAGNGRVLRLTDGVPEVIVIIR